MFEPLADVPSGDHDHRVFLIRAGQLLVFQESETSVRALTIDEAHVFTGGRHPELMLGRHGTRLYWAAELPEHVETVPLDHRLDGLRSLHGHLDDHEWNIGGRATQLLDWQRDHQFCGRCGGRMERAPGERAMRCPTDGLHSYPRLSPAVIMLVERDDGRALLGRSGRWEVPMYSTLAGFVEAGESLEETVQREVFEEVGLRVGDIRYFGSQPWPFPNSLMVGFTARWIGGDIRIDEDEIIDAQWFAPDALPRIPGRPSIARALIDDWLDRST